jgi:3-oxoadipate enol-lactonase
MTDPKPLPALVLFHAFPLSSEMWEPQARALKNRARLILIDLPGFGSAKPFTRGTKPSIAGMARLAAKGLDRLGVSGPVMAAGISMGGYVALEFARLYPKRVRALGLFSTRPGPDTQEQKKKRRALAQSVLSEGTGLLVKKSAPALLGKTTLRRDPALLRRIGRMIRKNKPQGPADALLAMAGRRDNTAVLKRFRGPVLVIAGREDGVIPPDESRAMGRLLRRGEVRVLAGAGHLVNLEKPLAFDRAVADFLTKRLG